MTRKRKRGFDPRTNAEKGLGSEHQRERREALASMVEGMPCPICGLPMSRAQSLDLDHVIPRVMGGIGGPTRLTHSTCNQRAGARLASRNKRNGGRRPQRQKPRYPQW